MLCGVQRYTSVRKPTHTQNCIGRLVYEAKILYMRNMVRLHIGLHTGNPAPFLYTPSSLLPEHSVLTDVQQATGRNGQQWITCRSGREGTRPQIWMGSDEVAPSNISNSTITIGLDTQISNGLYHCSSAHSEKEYFSLFLRSPGMCMHYLLTQQTYCTKSCACICTYSTL